jgi:hypothetical protein
MQCSMSRTNILLQRRGLPGALVAAAILLSSGGAPARGSEQDALAISAVIQQRHVPNGTVIDPVFASSTSNTIVGYTRGADSAIWTGHYLAAEAFRFKVTGAADALNNVRNALAGIRALRVVTGIDVLARCLVPVDWPFASSITTEEASHGIFQGTVDGKSYYWVGGTSRDEYSGVFFGLGVAYDMVDDPDVRSTIQNEATALLNFLLSTFWTVVMPDFSISTTFLGQPEEQLTFLQVGRHVNPGRFGSKYQSYRAKLGLLVFAPVAVECLDPRGSYFKFNLDEINLFNLWRLEDLILYQHRFLKAQKILRATLQHHGNPHFNMIDRALRGPNSDRDAETGSLLDQWLQRPRRDFHVDWSQVYQSCDTNQACDPIPVARRVPTDFLWQRSPFELSGGGAGTIETAGIDYILPYWMARFYGVIQ